MSTQGAALEIQSVIREVCDQVLGDKGLSVQDLRKRAVAIGILGDVFQVRHHASHHCTGPGPWLTVTTSTTHRQSRRIRDSLA